MSTTCADRWFADPELDLSFHLEDAAATEWTPAVTESQLKTSVGKRGTFGQPIFTDVPMANPRRSSKVPNLNEQYRRAQAEGPMGKGQDLMENNTRPVAIEITPNKRRSALAPRRSPNQRQSALLTIAEFESSASRPLSSYKYSAQTTSYPSQTKPLPQYQSPPRPRATSTVSSLSAQESTASTNTSLDYSNFYTPVQNLQYTGAYRQDVQPSQGNPQPRPEQFIQQSARRPMNRGNNSPRQASFNVGQKGQKVFRVNSRGANRRASIKKAHQHALGKPKPVGDIRNIPMSSVGAQRVHVVRPSERPHIVGIPPLHKNPATRRSQYPVLQNATPTERPALAIISITPPPSEIADNQPQELAVTASPQELSAGEFEFPSPQVPETTIAPKLITPPPSPPAYAPSRSKTPDTLQAPKSAPLLRPKSMEVLRPRSMITSKPLPSIPPLVTGWPSWGHEKKNETQKSEEKKVEEKKIEEETIEEKKEDVKTVLPPSPTGTTWYPAEWKDEVKPTIKKDEPKTAEEVQKEKEPKITEVKVEPEQKTPEVKAEPKKILEIPEILRIGNKQNSSLSQRLSSLDALDILSRY